MNTSCRRSSSSAAFAVGPSWVGGFFFNDCAALPPMDTEVGVRVGLVSTPKAGSQSCRSRPNPTPKEANRPQFGSARNTPSGAAMRAVTPAPGTEHRPWLSSSLSRADELGCIDPNVRGDCSHARLVPASINETLDFRHCESVCIADLGRKVPCRVGITRLSHADCESFGSHTCEAFVVGNSGALPILATHLGRARVAPLCSPQPKVFVVSIPRIFNQTRKSGQR